MDYQSLFQDLRRRPNAYGLSGGFGEYVAFINGCDAGNEWGLLVGFPEWLELETGIGANLTWEAQILTEASIPHTVELRRDTPENSAAVTLLFDRLISFLSARGGRGSISALISRHSRSRDGDG